MKLLEVACFNVASAMLAEATGADRIELCADYPAGGITPGEQMITSVRNKVRVPLHVIIRPRGGNFVYTGRELKRMKDTVLFCKQNGIDGVVFGALTNTNEIHESVLKELLDLAWPMSFTYHRAIDSANNLDESVGVLIRLGVQRVLTSGGGSSAMEGLQSLKRMNTRYGKNIGIIVGGGVRSSNIRQLIETGCSEFHSSAIVGDGFIADPREIRLLKKSLS